MQRIIRPHHTAWLLVGALLSTATIGHAGDTIESAQYQSGSLSTNSPGHIYNFAATTNETVIVRVANEDSLRLEIPDVSIYFYDNGSNRLLTATSDNITVYELTLPITNSGLFYVYCTLPASLLTYSNSLAYSVSMLRIPEVPPSYGDLDVGVIHSGEYKYGTINVGADLDVATFAVSNRCTVQVRMGQDDIALFPIIQIYDPQGKLVTTNSPPPPDYCYEVTATLTNVGIYTVVCNDYFNNVGRYAVSMIKIPGTLWATDTDLGVIISGETLTGTINVPGDLDAALFSAVSNDIVRITMREVDSQVDPIIELFDPDGNRLAIGTDPLGETAVITNTLATSGVFTVICKAAFDRKQDIHYTLNMEFLPGSPSLFSMPAVPAGLAATDGTYSNRIDVTWSATEGANGYDVWRSYGTNESVQIFTNLLATTSPVYQDWAVTANVTYYYKVKSRNAYGVSTNFSNTDSGYCGASTATTAMRRALLIGINNYSPSYGPSPLNACINDANGMRDIFMLGDPSNRWNSTNLTLLTDSQATKVTIQNALHALANSSSAGDLAVYFQSSHGGTSGGSNTYICTYNANFTDAELAADLALFRTDTKVIIILDTCYSGGMFKLDGTPEVEWLFAERVMEHYHTIQQARFKSLGKSVPKELGQNIAFMTACDYDELSWENDSYGLYTGFLLTGCTLPEVDTNGDGQYSFLELHTYAAAETVAAKPTQHAQDYNPVLLDNTIARAVGSNVIVSTHVIYNDFDGDSASDMATFNPNTGLWRIVSLKRWMVLAYDNFVWGGPGFKPFDGDYDGDRATDANIYNELTGEWRIGSLKRAAVLVPSAFFGGPGLRPVSGDFNGDKISDAALYQQPDGYWYILTASTGIQLVWGESFTGSGFVPVSGDYDNDRIADLAMYHLKTGYWYIGSLVHGVITWGTPWGGTGLLPISGDYDGDGYSDLAVYQPITGLWYIWSLHRSAEIANGIKFGGSGYIPVPGDYNGDGYDDLAVYQPATGFWFLRTVDGSQNLALEYPIGGPGYIPVLPTW